MPRPGLALEKNDHDGAGVLLGRAISRFLSVELHAGKARLTCAILERWQEVCTLSLSCGTVHERILTQRFGVSSTEHEDLEAQIKGSLGLKGIAQFESEVKSKAGREIRLERSRETTEKFTFKAPDCGRLIKGLFQLNRQYWLTYEDSRFFSKASWTKVVTLWLNRIHDISKQIEDDLDCGCKPKPKSASEGVIEILAGNNVSILASYLAEEKRIRLPVLNRIFEGVSVEDLMFTFLDVSRRHFPRYLRFLAKENSPRIRCTFHPYTDVMERAFVPEVTGAEIAAKVAGAALFAQFPKVEEAEEPGEEAEQGAQSA